MPGSRLGDRGEALAADFLERLGWTILNRSFRVGHREVDLVARRDGVVAFVEVKTRAGLAFGHPLDAITPRKQQQIMELATIWIQRFGRAGDAYRFDAVAIMVNRGSAAEIEHVEDAWGI